MLILSIESSCDETSIAILEGETGISSLYNQLNSFKVLGSVISSQIDIHAKYGGVIPEIGARSHAEQIHVLLLEAANQALNNKKYLSLNDILKNLDYIFVTTNPGLVSALRVGLEFAKSLKYFIKQSLHKSVPLVEINHLHGHIASCFYSQNTLDSSLEKIDFLTDDTIFPHLHLLVSGGNSQLILIKNHTDFEILGKTLDDAAGESFDKIGRMLGFPYPGGVYLAKTAGLNQQNILNFPIGMQNNQLNFSYSGLKTHIRYFLEKQDPNLFIFEQKLSDLEVKNLLANNINNTKLQFILNTSISSQEVITEQLVNKIKMAKKQFQPMSFGLSGGVSANQLLRSKVSKLGFEKVFISPLQLTGDNAIMIGLAGIWHNIYNK